MQRFLEKHNHIGQDILEVFDFKQAPLFSYFFFSLWTYGFPLLAE